MKSSVIAAALLSVALVGCQNAEEKAEDAFEERAEANATAAGPAIAALGLSEAQLLDADLVAGDGTELGDVQAVIRGANGQVEALVVEIENSNPDRYVQVPLAGLTTVTRGMDTDIATPMNATQLAALPDADLTAR